MSERDFFVLDNPAIDVDHAGVVPGAGHLAEGVVHPVRILPDQILRTVDADGVEVPGCGFADIGELFEAGDGVTIGMFHGMCAICPGETDSAACSIVSFRCNKSS